MATATVDQITNLSMVEQRGGGNDNGVIMELRREALVKDLDVAATPDFRILQEALNNLPPGSGVGFGDSLTSHPGLVLVERIPRLVPGTTTTCIVELLYKRLFSSVDTLKAGVGQWIVRGGGSLRQFTTHRNQFGMDNAVCYTYPADPSNSAYPTTDPRLAGRTKCQSGEIQVDLPSDTLEFTGRLITPNPGSIARAWRGRTNLYLWNGGAPGTWRCTEVSFDPWDLGDPEFEQWLFNFFFQFDPTGWNPDAIFRDQLTGKPPINLVEGNGVIEVDWYPTLDFEDLFPP